MLQRFGCIQVKSNVFFKDKKKSIVELNINLIGT